MNMMRRVKHILWLLSRSYRYWIIASRISQAQGPFGSARGVGRCRNQPPQSPSLAGVFCGRRFEHPRRMPIANGSLELSGESVSTS
jgi:hypothetical protein